MITRLNIKPAIVLILLGVFLAGITPRTYFHCFFETHSESKSYTTEDGRDHFSKAEPGCDCNNIISTVPYVLTEYMDQGCITSYSNTLSAAIPLNIFASEISQLALRGPPVMISSSA